MKNRLKLLIPILILCGLFLFAQGPTTRVRLLDTNYSNYLQLMWNEDAAANQTLNFITGAADRTITFLGNPTLADWFDQAVKSTSNPSFATIDTGLGPNELYDMDQNVLTTSAMTLATLDTGQGANELYDMDQNVLQASSPTFVGGTFSGLTASVPVVTSAGSALASQTYANFKTSLVLAQADISGLTTASSPIFVTIKLSGLTDGYIPYHVADATGLANSVIFQNGTNIGIGTTDIEAWNLPTIEFTSSAIYSGGINGVYLANNVYMAGGYKYKTTNKVAFSGVENGEWRAYTAASGNADAACTLTLRAKVDNPGDFYTNDGTVSSLSDIKGKDKTGEFNYGLKEILLLKPAMYKHRKDELKGFNFPVSDNEFVSLSAQDVQKVIPEAVKNAGQGYLGLTINPIVYAQVNAIKELDARIKVLESKIK